MAYRVIVILALLASSLLFATCGSAVPGWSRDGVDSLTDPDDTSAGGDTTNNEDNGGTTPAPGGDTHDDNPVTPPPPSADDDDDPAGPGGGDGGDVVDVLDVLAYDIPTRTVSLAINPPQLTDLRLVLDYPQGLESVPGKDSIIPAGTETVDVVFTFTDDTLLDANVSLTVFTSPGDVETGWEYLNISRPLAITDFAYEVSLGCLRGWVNLCGTTTITLEPPPGINVQGSLEVVLDEPGFFEFPITLDDGFESGVAVARASDAAGNTHQKSAQITAPGAYMDDMLYIYAPDATAGVDEPVTVLVATGRPAHPLQFLNCVTVTLDDTGSYVPDSFSVGEPGGGRLGVDGLWAQMSIPEDNFLDLGDSFMPGPGQDIGGGRKQYQFAIVTMGPFPAADAEGVLFSFQVVFNAAGEHRVGLRERDSNFSLTYYGDSTGQEFFWGGLMADDNGNLNPDIFGYDNVIHVQ